MGPVTTSVLGGLVEVGARIIDRVFPDPAQRAQAQMELLKMQRDGELEEMRVALSAILAEAQSADPWTSRARPSFLYVMYVMILAAIPVGIAHVINPSAVATFTTGVQGWLGAIPDELWWLFGAGYLGYTGSRMFEKRRGAK